MEDFKQPDILKNNLDTVVLKLISLGFKNIEDFNFISKPHQQDILEAYESLAGLGAMNFET